MSASHRLSKLMQSLLLDRARWSPASIGLVLLIGAILLVVLRRVWQSRTTYRDDIPVPPRLSSWVPYIGSAISMTSGDPFWVKAEAEQGPVFRVLAMGDEKIYTTDPDIITWVYRNSKACDFFWIRRHMTAYIYGMKRSLAFSDVWEHLFPIHHRSLSPNGIQDLNARYVDQLEQVMLRRISTVGAGTERINLVNWVFEVMYTASSTAFFSPSFPVEKTMAPFRAFDKAFPLLAIETLPSFMVVSARKTVDNMHELLLEWWNDIRGDPKIREVLAPSLACMLDLGEQEGWSDGCMMSVALAELWALEANAPYAAMWTLLEIARRPEVYKRLHDEIIQATRDLSPPTIATLMRMNQSELVARCPQLNAAYQETLRLHAESYSMRKILDPITIPANLIKSGVGSELGLSLQKDDQIICVTRKSAVSPDSEWGPDAGTWDHRRFLKGGPRKEQMWPFGGGVSMCEGRHFASIEILTFLIFFISNFRIDIVSDKVEADRTRIGLGILQPKGKVMVDLVRR